MNNDVVAISASVAAGTRSGAYSLISQGFRYPDEKWFKSLARVLRWTTWLEHLAELNEDATRRLRILRQSLASTGEPHFLSDIQEAYAALFGHAVRGVCPPYELEYGTSEIIQRASDLADIGGFYAAFGLVPGGDLPERPDHVSVECEFMQVMTMKEAYGLERNNRPLVEAAEGAQRKFLKVHLGSWLPAFTHRVQRADPEGLYSQLAAFSEAFIEGECRRFGVSHGSPYLELRPAEPADETTQSCGRPPDWSLTSGQRSTPLTIRGMVEGNV